MEAVLRATKQSGALQREDLEAARFLIFWTANAVLPTEDFTSSWENAQLADGEFMSSLSERGMCLANI